jgi:hypothetical protein
MSRELSAGVYAAELRYGVTKISNGSPKTCHEDPEEE